MPHNLTTAAISLFFAGVILLLIRRQRLGGWQTVWWLCLAAGLVVLGLFPALTDRAGEWLGVHYPPVLPVVVGLCLVLVKTLPMDMAWTRQERKIRILAQKMAGMEAELRELKDRDRTGQGEE